MTRDKLVGMGRKFRARRKVACTPTLKFILGAIDTQAGDAEKVNLFYFCGFLGLNLILQETDTSSTSDSPPYIHTPPAAPVKRRPELPCSDSPAKKTKKAAEESIEEEEDSSSSDVKDTEQTAAASTSPPKAVRRKKKKKKETYLERIAHAEKVNQRLGEAAAAWNEGTVNYHFFIISYMVYGHLKILELAGYDGTMKDCASYFKVSLRLLQNVLKDPSYIFKGE